MYKVDVITLCINIYQLFAQGVKYWQVMHVHINSDIIAMKYYICMQFEAWIIPMIISLVECLFAWFQSKKIINFSTFSFREYSSLLSLIVWMYHNMKFKSNSYISHWVWWNSELATKSKDLRDVNHHSQHWLISLINC